MKEKIFNIIFWGLFIVLMGTWITDFALVKTERSPIFCITKKTHEYEDGEVKECTGLGYRVYEYDRDSLNVVSQFGPIFMKMQE